MGRDEGSGWGTHVYLWQIHFDIWENQYNIVKFKNKIKFKKNKKIKTPAYSASDKVPLPGSQMTFHSVFTWRKRQESSWDPCYKYTNSTQGY